MSLVALGANLLGNLLPGKGAIAKSQGRGINRAGEGIVRAGHGCPLSSNSHNKMEFEYRLIL